MWHLDIVLPFARTFVPQVKVLATCYILHQCQDFRVMLMTSEALKQLQRYLEYLLTTL